MGKRSPFGFRLIFIILALALLLAPLSCTSAGKKSTIEDTNTNTNTKTASTTKTAVTTTSASKTTPTTTNSLQTTATSAPNISLDIELPPVIETMETLMFKALPDVALNQIPVNTQWQWDFGDGTPLETK
jgi:hypothetical protein